jgi:hypothetical protein
MIRATVFDWLAHDWLLAAWTTPYDAGDILASSLRFCTHPILRIHV